MRTKIKTNSEYQTAAEYRAAHNVPLLGYSITQWCAALGISRATYYKLPDGGPEVVPIGTRKIITPDASDRWLRERAPAGRDQANTTPTATSPGRKEIEVDRPVLTREATPAKAKEVDLDRPFSDAGEADRGRCRAARSGPEKRPAGTTREREVAR